MKRLLLLLAATSFALLPAVSMAETHKPTEKEHPPKAAPHKPGKPGGGGGAHPGPAAGHHQQGPQGHQFFHRGHAFTRIHGPAFVWPHGWRYRRWSIGVVFPVLFLAPEYYYNDWAALELQAPPPGYAWVRFGPDLVLVNIESRVVEDVVYGVFE
jgi:Ni/Co efflux regulator RcnB